MFKNLRFPVAVAALILIASIVNTVAAQGALVWSDEFDGPGLNDANWEIMLGDGTAYGLPAGWGNNERQFYTARPENVFVSNGLLHIVARREPFAGYGYTSARIRTLNKQDFLYGRMEARIRLPEGAGIWPAFWMLPTNSPYGGWAASGEIDIMESVNIATTIHGTIHHGDQWPGNVFSGGTLETGTNYAADFHNYAVEWSPDRLRWFVDGQLYHTETSPNWFSTLAPGNPRAPFDNAFHFLLNVAVGGNFPGPPDDPSIFPQEMLVDWVRVYDLQSAFGSQSHAVPGRIEAEDFDEGGNEVSYFDCDLSNNGGQYRPTDSVDIEASSDGGFNIGWLCAGEWMEYSVDVASGGCYWLLARVASQSTGGDFMIELDGNDVTGAVNVPVTGDWQNWTTVIKLVELPGDATDMRFINGSSADEYNLQWLQFVPVNESDTVEEGAVNLTECPDCPGPFVLDFDPNDPMVTECLAGPPAVPTASEWGMLLMCLFLGISGTLVYSRRVAS